MKYRIVVSAIIRKNRKILLGKKKSNTGPYPNCWLLIGGGANLEDESLEQALKREIKEETNIEICDIEALPVAEDYEKDKYNEETHYIFITFLASYKSGKLKPGSDILKLRWFTRKELKSINLARPTIKRFQSFKWV